MRTSSITVATTVRLRLRTPLRYCVACRTGMSGAVSCLLCTKMADVNMCDSITAVLCTDRLV